MTIYLLQAALRTAEPFIFLLYRAGTLCARRSPQCIQHHAHDKAFTTRILIINSCEEEKNQINDIICYLL